MTKGVFVYSIRNLKTWKKYNRVEDMGFAPGAMPQFLVAPYIPQAFFKLVRVTGFVLAAGQFRACYGVQSCLMEEPPETAEVTTRDRNTIPATTKEEIMLEGPFWDFPLTPYPWENVSVREVERLYGKRCNDILKDLQDSDYGNLLPERLWNNVPLVFDLYEMRLPILSFEDFAQLPSNMKPREYETQEYSRQKYTYFQHLKPQMYCCGVKLLNVCRNTPHKGWMLNRNPLVMMERSKQKLQKRELDYMRNKQAGNHYDLDNVTNQELLAGSIAKYYLFAARDGFPL